MLFSKLMKSGNPTVCMRVFFKNTNQTRLLKPELLPAPHTQDARPVFLLQCSSIIFTAQHKAGLLKLIQMG